MEKKKRRIAITGGICSGKTTVLNILKDIGAFTISCDSEIKKIKQKPRIKESIFSKFGIDSANNSDIAELVFSDQDKRRALEGVLYPELHRTIEKLVCDSGEQDVFIEVPLLYENELDVGYEKVVVTSCSIFERRKRAVLRGMNKEVFDKFVNIQLPSLEKEKRADYVINTKCDIESLKVKVLNIYKNIKYE